MDTKILDISPLQMPWATQDPFIFCAYHYDLYPSGNAELGPKDSLAGRNIGQDFAGKDGWSMYHGTKVPGFPAHPHRGFETVTIAAKGMVDHSDSIGGLGRFGNGDVQWLTAGKGVQHAEMFPLIKDDSNPLELFQIWLNLPQKSKMVTPHYKMLWREDIPIIKVKDNKGVTTEINLISGHYKDQKSLSSTPDSWAADPTNEVQIWTVKMAPNATFILPAAKGNVNRAIYYHKGDTMEIADTEIAQKHRIVLTAKDDIVIKNGASQSSFLFLQGRPINEPVAQHGPFVMNTQAEIQEAMQDYQRTAFGGWPWPSSSPTSPKSKGRFANYGDGTEDIKD